MNEIIFSRIKHILDYCFLLNLFIMSLPLLIQSHLVVLYASGMYMQWWYWMVHG